jgi:hypothetical protein
MTPAPHNPRLVLLAAIILPGSGHVLQGRAQRGLMFLFFMIILGWASSHVMPETASFFGRHIGGIFIYGMSIIDAYKWSKVSLEVWKHTKTKVADSSQSLNDT